MLIYLLALKMGHFKEFLSCVIIVILTLSHPGHGRANPSNILHRQEAMDNGNFIVDWFINFEQQTAHFLIAVKTRSYIGFGISLYGSMDGSDIVIGGVFDNGTTYFSVRGNTQVYISISSRVS